MSTTSRFCVTHLLAPQPIFPCLLTFKKILEFWSYLKCKNCYSTLNANVSTTVLRLVKFYNFLSNKANNQKRLNQSGCSRTQMESLPVLMGRWGPPKHAHSRWICSRSSLVQSDGNGAEKAELPWHGIQQQKQVTKIQSLF